MTDHDTPRIAERVTIRLGPLRQLLARRLARTGQTAAGYLRQLLADDLGTEPPDMPVGNPDIANVSARRWARRKTQRD